MLITDPAELAQFLPNHVLQNLDNLQGFFAISESDFLAERLGRPLLAAVQQHYDELHPVLTFNPIIPDAEPDPWRELILLCQPVIAFDAVARAADIQAVSVNQGGINIAETGGYDIAPDKYIANYKAQCVKEAHAAVNRLLIKLEDWQKQVAQATADFGQQAPVPDASPSDSTPVPEASPSGTAPVPDGSAAPPDSTTPDNSSLLTPHSSLQEIVTLWQQSAYYYYIEGLLFSTAQQFGSYINIWDSREKFITLVPDIRYCQEVHLEAELGEEVIADIITRFHRGELSKEELKAYRMLQRTLSLYVEARAPMFSSRAKQARDEATGHMALTLRYIRDHHLFECSASAPVPDASPSGSTPAPCPKHPDAHHHDIADNITHCHCHCNRPGWLTSSLV